MPHAERVDESLERNLAARRNRGEQVAHRRFAVSFDLFQLELRIARLQGENIRRLLDPAALEEPFDLFFSQSLDVERAARDEMLQMFGLLERAGEFARAAEAHALLSCGIQLAHDGRL